MSRQVRFHIHSDTSSLYGLCGATLYEAGYGFNRAGAPESGVGWAAFMVSPRPVSDYLNCSACWREYRQRHPSKAAAS